MSKKNQQARDEQRRELYREWAADLLRTLEKHRSSYADWQERRREPTPSRQELAERIRTAFAGVVCGDGLCYASGWTEGVMTEEEEEVFRRMEERNDWTRITPDWLFATEECLSFVEPEGFRFLLPAYMLADLQYDCGWGGLDYHLLHRKDSGNLAILNAEQRACVSDYVNEKRLEDLQVELAEGENPGEWSFLLPWEKAQLPPGIDRKRAADDILLAFMQKHGMA